jgi:hypothetical protein
LQFQTNLAIFGKKIAKNFTSKIEKRKPRLGNSHIYNFLIVTQGTYNASTREVKIMDKGR